MIFKLIFSIWQNLPLKRKIITILSFLITCYLTMIIFSFLFNIILAISIFYIITKLFRKFLSRHIYLFCLNAENTGSSRSPVAKELLISLKISVLMSF